jgi:hypothetical protein
MKNGMSVKKFLMQNPNATTKAVVKATGASVKTVYSVRWKLKQERKIINLSEIRPNPRLIGDAVARPKARLATSADFPITDKTEFIMPDPVNHPAHYTTGGIETIDFIEAKQLNYNLGNAVKYITRADHKGNRLQDLQKAKWYLEREILSAHI